MKAGRWPLPDGKCPEVNAMMVWECIQGGAATRGRLSATRAETGGTKTNTGAAAHNPQNGCRDGRKAFSQGPLSPTAPSTALTPRRVACPRGHHKTPSTPG